MKRIAVLGGGIAGLTAAYELRKNPSENEITLFEASDHFGGKMISQRIAGCLVEGGPDSLLTEKPWALRLCHELGLEDQLLGSNDAQRSFSILRNGTLHLFPAGCKLFVPQKLLPMLTTPLLSMRGKLRMAMELFGRYPKNEADISLGTFVRNHFGDEVLERLAGPLLGGIYGGNPDNMSMKATFPRLWDMEQKHGSLIIGMRKAMRKLAAMRGNQPAPPLFTTLKNGMQTLPDRLQEEVKSSLRPNSPVTSLQRTASGWRVNGEYFDEVISALPASVAAPLLAEVCSELGELLGQQQCTSSATLSLIFNREDLPDALPAGSGFMSAYPVEGLMVGCTWIGNKFEGRVPEDRFACRVFLGGPAGEETLEQLTDAELHARALTELRAVCPFIPEHVLGSWLTRWPRSNPQYSVGHLDWLDAVRKRADALGAIRFIGSSFDGVSVSDCVKQAQTLTQH